MPTPEQSLTILNNFLDGAIDSFSEDIPQIQDQIFKKVQTLLNDLDISHGSVKASAKNLRKINRIKREIERIVLSDKYLKEVSKFNQAFERSTDLQTSYFKSIQSDLTTPDFIKTLETASIQNTKAALTQSGIQANIVDKAGDIIQRNITEGANFSDLIDDMRSFLTKTEQSVGALSRYTSQIVTDSLNTYAAEYNRFVSDNLNMQWYIYTGALVKDSRAFCRSLVKKKYVNKSEFGRVAHGSFVPKPSDLKGLKPNTNATNLQIFRGGWHCQHLLSPIAEEFVPKSVVRKSAALGQKVNAESIEIYRGSDGKFTKPRTKLHKKIEKDFLSKGSAVSNKEKTVFMTGGAPASGKSAIVDTGKLKHPKNIVPIDSDAIKGKMPDYQKMVSKKVPNAASFAHEESSMLSKNILKTGVSQDKNILLDGVGDGSIESLTKKTNLMRSRGHRVSADYVTMDEKLSLKLSDLRGQKTGRFVPEEYIRNAHKQVSIVVPQALKKGLFDDFRLWDTNIQNRPRLVATYSDGVLDIKRRTLWQDFLDKGK